MVGDFPKSQLESDVFVRDLLVRIARKRAVTLTLMRGEVLTIFVTSMSGGWIRGCYADPKTNHDPVWVKESAITMMHDSDLSYANRAQYSKEQTKNIGYYCAPMYAKARAAIAEYEKKDD